MKKGYKTGYAVTVELKRYTGKPPRHQGSWSDTKHVSLISSYTGGMTKRQANRVYTKLREIVDDKGKANA